MKKVGKTLVVVGLVVSLVGCTPREGGRCTNPGETVTTKDGVTLRCQTNDGQRTPRWTAV